MAKSKKSNPAPAPVAAEPSKAVEASEASEQPHVWLGPGNLIWQGQTLQPGDVIHNYVPFEAEVEHVKD